MNVFTKYKLKISLFVSFVVFTMIFFTGISFFYFNYFSYKKNISREIYHIKKHIKNLNNEKFKKIISKLNDLAVLEIIWDIIPTQKEIRTISENFLSNLVYIEKDNMVVYKNFDINKCDIKFYCIKLDKNWYTIIIWVKKINEDIWKNIVWYAIFSILISILFFPVIYWIVSKLTKPMEKNFEFMKNFVNNAWHELKTPIANISLSSQILQQKKEFDEEIVNDLVQESNKISNIIDTLLQISLLSKFQKKENINIKQEIEKILNEFKTELTDFNLETKLENVFLNTNIHNFDILFRNLLKNAIKYNNENKYIKISLNKNKLIIENSWNEIKKQDRKKIFDLFYRIEKEKNGYGLGLALVKKVIEINKWKIKIESENGINKFIILF